MCAAVCMYAHVTCIHMYGMCAHSMCVLWYVHAYGVHVVSVYMI